MLIMWMQWSPTCQLVDLLPLVAEPTRDVGLNALSIDRRQQRHKISIISNNKSVVNLSSYPLSEIEVSVPSRGKKHFLENPIFE